MAYALLTVWSFGPESDKNGLAILGHGEFPEQRQAEEGDRQEGGSKLVGLLQREGATKPAY